MPERFTLQKPPQERVDPLNPVLVHGDELQAIRDAHKMRSGLQDILRANLSPENQNTQELFDMAPPDSELSAGGRDFYFSPVFEAGGRKHSIGYTMLENGVLAPRLFYKSRSDGFWRVSPIIDKEVDKDGTEELYYSKGEVMVDGYVRETRLSDDISEHLELKEAGATVSDREYLRQIKEHFLPEKLGETATYKEEAFGIKIRGIKDFFLYQPGAGFHALDDDKRPARERIAELQVPEERKADFTGEPIKTTTRHHEMLGDVTIESFLSNDGRLVWNMARTKEGIVWVNGLTKPEPDPVSSYGTDHEVLLGGVIDNKPIEYMSQLHGLTEGQDYIRIPGTSYAQLTIIDNLEPIREYRAARLSPDPYEKAA